MYVCNSGGHGLTYEIIYADDALDHLRGVGARLRAIVVDEIERRLAHQPTVETRNRKRMRRQTLAPWELRIGDARVYYEAREEPEPVVEILAVGVKEHNRVRIGREVVEL
jgi:mRNA-degrading endonuclease RelE of RelBE toxin-antitoxin system